MVLKPPRETCEAMEDCGVMDTFALGEAGQSLPW